jgi:hypothetical protein
MFMSLALTLAPSSGRKMTDIGWEIGHQIFSEASVDRTAAARSLLAWAA